jgi:hypothetical protein
VDLESELPPAAPPLELRGTDFRVEDGTPVAIEVSGELDAALRAGPLGTKAVLLADLPDAGLHVLSFFGTRGGGQSWGVDQCRRAVLCPAEGTVPEWHTVMAGEFTAGLHSFEVVLAPGSVVERVRLEQKKEKVADYLATVKRLGLDLGGDDGPLTREKAGEARSWVAAKRTPAEDQCGEVVIAETLVASSSSAGPAPVFPGVPPTIPNPVPPIGPPLVVAPAAPLSPVQPLP